MKSILTYDNSQERYYNTVGPDVEFKDNNTFFRIRNEGEKDWSCWFPLEGTVGCPSGNRDATGTVRGK